jgi:S1-C subfamily serine protease
VSKAVLDLAGDDVVRLVDELAHRQLIRTLATQGHVSDVSPHVIAYEASSASGSSGAPVFNQDGMVIGVNQAMLQRVSGVHVALPIHFVNELLGQLAQSDSARH